MFARFAFDGASSVLVYGKQTQAKFSSDKKSVWKSLGFAVRAAAEVRDFVLMPTVWMCPSVFPSVRSYVHTSVDFKCFSALSVALRVSGR